MEATANKAPKSIFPLIFFIIFLGTTALATVVAAADKAPGIDTIETVG